MKVFRHLLSVCLCILPLLGCAQGRGGQALEDEAKQDQAAPSTPEKNLLRAIELVTHATDHYFDESGTALSRYYNPYTGKRSKEIGSVWMYTSGIEATNAILSALQTSKRIGESELYDRYHQHFVSLLSRLYDGLEYYAGTFTLTSYTRTKEWTVYAVDRAGTPGTANVDGIYNVYDDQMWLVRELLASYALTHDQKYLDKAEYLTAYVLDGWDCTRDADGKENGGITWGPGYVTKHACSNGPMISPLVELHTLYAGKADRTTHHYITEGGARKDEPKTKSDYYLDYARAIYDYQKHHLLNERGVYDDMMGGSDSPHVQYTTVDGVRYRTNTPLPQRIGPAISYNSGTMLSGGADLYRATGDSQYLQDITALAKASFEEFTTPGTIVPGHYTFDIRGFRNWFDCVLLRGYFDTAQVSPGVDKYLSAFQDNLDYAYDNYLYQHMLPTNLLAGWNKSEPEKNSVEAMFTYAFATEYALLALHEWRNSHK